MTSKDFVVSADGHLLEPVDLFKTRLPAHLRDRAVWEEDFELDEPLIEGGARVFAGCTPPAMKAGRCLDIARPRAARRKAIRI